MDETNLSLQEQVIVAKRDKLIAETEKAKAEKAKLDTENKELRKEHQKPLWKKKETWSIFAGTLIAWTAVAVYITFSVLPLADIRNNEVTLENTKKSDTLYLKEKQLHLAYDTLHAKAAFLATITTIVNKKDIDNKNLLIARHRVDSSYSVLYKLYTHKHEISHDEVKDEIIQLKNYLDDYKKQLKNESNYSIIRPSTFSSFASTVSSIPSSTLLQYSGTSNIDSIMKIGAFGFAYSNNIKIRPYYNGVLIKNLTIDISPKSQILSGSLIRKLLLNEKIQVGYSLDDGYVAKDFDLTGSYVFEINSDEYKVDNIVTSDPLLCSTTDNQITFSSFFASNYHYLKNNLTLDLNLIKK